MLWALRLRRIKPVFLASSYALTSTMECTAQASLTWANCSQYRLKLNTQLRDINRYRVPYPILVWRFGSDLTLVGLSGEVCVDYALRLKRELDRERTWVAGYANQVPCYIPSDRVLAEGVYEAGWGSRFGRAVAEKNFALHA